MTTLHVVPDNRGTWRVFDDASPAPLSQHTSETAAELAACRCAGARHADAVVVHDRYGRVHLAPHYERRRFGRGGRGHRPPAGS